MEGFLNMSLPVTICVIALIVGLGVVINIVISKIRNRNKKEK